MARGRLAVSRRACSLSITIIKYTYTTTSIISIREKTTPGLYAFKTYQANNHITSVSLLRYLLLHGSCTKCWGAGLLGYQNKRLLSHRVQPVARSLAISHCL